MARLARPQRPPSGTKDGGIQIRHSANLPHWTREGATYAVTFRLADSLPKEAMIRFARAREEAREIGDETRRRSLLSEIAEREEEELNRGAGACLLAEPEARSVVASALRHFDGTRYSLFAYVVMPNHVHALVRPIPPHVLSGILHSWKSFTAKRLPVANGGVWQGESYDHLVRDHKDFAAQLRYIQFNPERAGLNDGYELWTAANVEELWFAEREIITSGTGVPPVQASGSLKALDESVSFSHRRDADATLGSRS